MTFKDLQKLVQSDSGPQVDSKLFRSLRGKPFWVWDKPEHKQADRTNNGACCFNHIIGLPTKDGAEKPMFDYEKILYSMSLTDYGNALVHSRRNVELRRKRIASLLAQAATEGEIAQTLNVDQSTISRDMNADKEYY